MDTNHQETISYLLKTLQENNLSSIEYGFGDLHIKLEGESIKKTIAPTKTIAPEIIAPTENLNTKVLAPMVGIAYLKKQASDTVFVNKGDMVKEGDILCVIEAMKTFNPVKSPKAGKIIDILIDNGTAVEFNQPLFVVE